MNFQNVHKRLSWALHVAMLTAVLGLSAFAPMLATAQVNPEIANCEEIKDEATSTQAEICSAHPGCRLVFAVQRTCVRAKKFLTNLQDAIGEGTKSLFGTRKEVTPEAVFQASLPETARSVKSVVDNKDSASSPVKDAISTISQAIRGNGPALTGQTPKGEPFVYYGDAKNGKAEGTGTFIDADGRVQRGIFKDGGLDQGVKVTKEGDVYNGSFSSDNLQNGKWIRPNGTSFEGEFKSGSRQNGREYDPTGKLVEEGRYESDKLYVGKQYDPDGRAVEIDKVKDQRIVALAAKEEADRRTRKTDDERRQAEQRRTEELQQAEKLKAEERARSAARFQDDLKTMNPGQLYARADELSEKGDKEGSRAALRSLISRFPDHKLAESATNQLVASNSNASRSENIGRDLEPKIKNSLVMSASEKSKSSCFEIMHGFTKLVQTEIDKYGPNWMGAYEGVQRKKLVDSHPACANDLDEKRKASQNLEGRRINCNYMRQRGRATEDCTNGTANSPEDGRIYENYIQQALNGKLQLPEIYKSPECRKQRNIVDKRASDPKIQNALIRGGVVDNYQYAMWITQEEINVGDQYCKDDSDWASARAHLKSTYDSAAKSCAKLSANGSCIPKLP